MKALIRAFNPGKIQNQARGTDVPWAKVVTSSVTT
jgi:hypothetical protein